MEQEKSEIKARYMTVWRATKATSEKGCESVERRRRGDTGESSYKHGGSSRAADASVWITSACAGGVGCKGATVVRGKLGRWRGKQHSSGSSSSRLTSDTRNSCEAEDSGSTRTGTSTSKSDPQDVRGGVEGSIHEFFDRGKRRPDCGTRGDRSGRDMPVRQLQHEGGRALSWEVMSWSDSQCSSKSSSSSKLGGAFTNPLRTSSGSGETSAGFTSSTNKGSFTPDQARDDGRENDM